ncbi:AfsR/SARP family transcriptional regulator [Parafrankia discariae]|uniref:AfsR/SARP family transcriptional regulator n=1 Tax=Parafrankia discariae TaxID=365528 RepID=UPI00036D1C06|nr:AfsR/SARP family transcriptional regulator [Parafrankia discariae]
MGEQAGNLRLGVLGVVTADRGGTTLTLGGRRQRAVLAMLIAARGDVLSAARLLSALWPDEQPPKAQVALHAYVSHLRRGLEPDRPARSRTGLIVSQAPGYALRVDPDAVDAWRFEAAVARWSGALADDPDGARSGLTAALALWRGEAYAEFSGQPWAVAESGRLAQLRSVARETVAEARLLAGEAAALVPELESMAAAEPLREGRWRLLALALYRSHRQGDALAALRRARGILTEELGVDPGPQLRALEADILAQSPALDGPAAAAAAQPPPVRVVPVPPAVAAARPPILLGRHDVVDQLARSTGVQLALVTGEPGSGKTAVAEELSRRLAADGWEVAWGRCPEVEGTPPLWPWAALLRALPGAGDVAGLRPLVADRAGPDEHAGEGAGGDAGAGLAGDAATRRFRLRRAVAEFLRVRARDHPLLVVLDDAHRADDGTLDLLVHAAAELTGEAVYLVVTYRDDEVGPSLSAALARLATRHPVRVELGPLPGDAVAELIRRLAERPLDGRTLATAVARSDGNPFYARELGRLLASGESLAAVPVGVRDVVRHRAASLPGDALTVLRMAAVIGRDIDLDVLLEVAGLPEDGVLDAIDAALVAGLVHADGDSIRFQHVLVRDAFYEQVSPPRRARWHALVARALERLRPGDVTVLARHYAAAGAGFADRAAAYAARAAEEAERRSAHADAAALWGQAATATADPRERILLLLAQCRALTVQGGSGAATRRRAEAIELARRTGDRNLLTRAITAWTVPTSWTQRRYLEWDSVLIGEIRELLGTGQVTEADRCRLLCALVTELDGSSDPALRADGRAALEIAGRLDDPDLVGLAAAAGLRLTYFGVPLGERESLADLLLATGRRSGRPGLTMLGHHAALQVAAARGELTGFRHHRAQVEAIAGTFQLGAGALTGLAAQGLEHSLAGRFAEAERAYARLGAAMDAAGAHDSGVLALACTACVREAAGGLEALRPALEAAYEKIPSLPTDLIVRVLLDAGEPAEARRRWRPDEPHPADFLGVLWRVLRLGNALAFEEHDVARGLYRELLPYADQLAGAVSGSLTCGPVAMYLGDAAAAWRDPRLAAEHYAAAARLARRAGAAHYAVRAEMSLRRCAARPS